MRRRGWREGLEGLEGGVSGSHRATGADARGNGEAGDDGCHGSGGDAPVRVARAASGSWTRCVIASRFRSLSGTPIQQQKSDIGAKSAARPASQLLGA